MNKNIAPICLFVYNRPWHTRKTIEALAKNSLSSQSDLFIFSDGTKNKEDESNVASVRKFIKNISGFKSVIIIEQEKNFGLANSIIGGVTKIINKYGKIIVMEDDLITSPYFLEYMNNALDLYEEDNGVVSIHGYTLPAKSPLPETFFLRGSDCWGWATWKRGWDLFEPDGKKLLENLEQKNLTKKFNLDGNFHYTEMLQKQIAGLNDSWAIRWHASAFLADKLTLYPGKSLINNIGQDASGTNKSNSSIFKTKVTQKKVNVEKIQITENHKAKKIVQKFLKSLKPGIAKRILRKIKHLIYEK